MDMTDEQRRRFLRQWRWAMAAYVTLLVLLTVFTIVVLVEIF